MCPQGVAPWNSKEYYQFQLKRRSDSNCVRCLDRLNCSSVLLRILDVLIKRYYYIGSLNLKITRFPVQFLEVHVRAPEGHDCATILRH